MFDPRKALQKLFSAPAEALERTIEFAEHEEKGMMNKKPLQLAGEYFNTLGPGLTTGAADDDPSGIGTYSQTGAQFGFQLLWLSIFTFPLMAMVQEMCARIGLVTGEGLAANILKHHSRRALYFITILLFAANTLNIAADLGAMSASTTLLFPRLNLAFVLVALALVSLFLQIFTTYARYARFLKYTALALLSYVFTAFAVHIDWLDALHHTFIPSFTFSKDQVFLLCAILGTTISPYLFFWQTSQEVEEDILKGQRTIAQRKAAVDQKGINRMRIDVWTGMFVSNLIMFFIIAACAATLHANGITTIATADQAASAIRPFGGELTYFFFALGIIGTGLLAVPVLAGSAAYAISECFGWKQGLYRKLKEAYAFYGVIIVSMLVGIIANFAHLDPIKGLIYSAVANGLVAPIVLFYIVRMSANKKIMHGQKNHPLITAFGWLTTVLMVASGIAAVASLFF
ncbi:MAG TPA: divalent metal cation transporter [Candidatus Paceibacterota bacterium]|jgi:NRAMP (natural resistance-associated macrophage protein)-like metal ion transporter|nr:divalent metal cation transporter [Candidatus Paceibacterota bacterium]